MEVEQQVVDLRSELSNANKTNHELQLSLDEAQRLIREKENELAELKSSAVIHMEAPPVQEVLLSQHDQLASVDDLQRLVNQQQDDLERQIREMVSLKEQLAYAQEALRDKDTILADRQSILDTVTSERATLSRAMEQNQSLKQQLLELQDAFVKTSNQNAELAAELQNEKNTSKERNTANENCRAQLEQLQEHCARREADYTALNQAYQMMSSDLIQAGNRIAELELIQSNCIGTATHFHEEGPHHSCSHELHPDGAVLDQVVFEPYEKESTRVAINHRQDLLDGLVHQLQVSFSWLIEQDTTRETVAYKPETDDPMELFTRWDRLVRSLIAERDKAVAVQAEQNRRHTAHIRQLPKVEEWRALQVAHSQLESKFTECMEKLSSASEERSRLEGIVAQLEMEAATVGEYVTLFAHRRAAAARRARSREQLLERFVQDRRRLRSRLKAMKELVPKSLDSGDISASSDGSPLKSAGEQLQDEFVSQFRRLLDEVGSTEEETKTEAGFHLLNDEDAVDECTAEPNEMTALKCASNSHTYTTLELLRRQALQHDCPHCQCCVGTLLEV
ncbi:unnamed protein product [Dicrocoelium dendriticum]|nr:unnamed protein product [Dicrocoelium dendriticum]